MTASLHDALLFEYVNMTLNLSYTSIVFKVIFLITIIIIIIIIIMNHGNIIKHKFDIPKQS